MSNINNFTKASDTTNFTGYPPFPKEQTNGTTQVGALADGNNGTTPFQQWSDVSEAVPAASRVVLSGAGVTGKNGQYAVSLSLSGGGTVQITASLTDARGNASVAIGTFKYHARSQQVAVTDSGLVSCVSRSNGASVIVSYPVAQVNAGFDNARPDGKNNLTAELVVTVLP